jgi:hypothetical protein
VIDFFFYELGGLPNLTQPIGRPNTICIKTIDSKRQVSSVW